MNTVYFHNVTDFDSLRKQYKKLVVQYHPDRNHDSNTTTIMQDVNAEYTTLSKKLATPEYWNVDAQNGHEWSQNRQDFHIDLSEKLRKVLYDLLSIDGLEVEITGYWFWVHGLVKNDERITQVKSLGCKWASKKKLWYYAGVPSRGRGKSTMDDIRNTYGSQKFTSGRAKDTAQGLAA